MNGVMGMTDLVLDTGLKPNSGNMPNWSSRPPMRC